MSDDVPSLNDFDENSALSNRCNRLFVMIKTLKEAVDSISFNPSHSSKKWYEIVKNETDSRLD